MESLKVWRPLPPGHGHELVLAIDFDATGRPEARFTDLAERLGPGYTLWETRPVPSAGPHGEAYVRGWAEELRTTQRPVRAILGFCAGAAFAPSLARRISGWQAAPVPLVLFDPEIVTPDTLYWQYSKIVDIASSVLTSAETDRALQAGREAHARCPGVATLGTEIRAALEEHVAVAFGRLGLDQERSEEIVETFAGFVEYLCAAGTLDPVPAWKTATVISSSSVTSGLNRLRATDRTIGNDVAATEIRLDLSHADLLRSPEAVDAVRDAVGAVE